MGGVTTQSRLEHLELLAKQTKHETQCALRANDRRRADLLRDLGERVAAAIASERGSASTFQVAERPATDRVTRRLAQLGVTSHTVKVWAHRVGLVDAVKRGRIGADLVEAWATAHEAAVGTCARCDRGMVPAQTWNTNAEQRPVWRQLGLRKAAARGLCIACLQWTRDNGVLDSYPLLRGGPASTTTGLCNRCGLHVALDDDGTCRDCVEVLELEAAQ